MGQTIWEWDPVPGIGAPKGGFLGFFDRWVPSQRAYFYCDPRHIKLTVLDIYGRHTGEAEIPGNIGNARALQLALKLLVSELEVSADNIVLAFLSEMPGSSYSAVKALCSSEHWLQRYERLSSLDETALVDACTRLKEYGLIDSRVEKENWDDGKSLFSLYLTSAGQERASTVKELR